MAQCKIAKVLANSVSLASESGKLIRAIFNNGDLGKGSNIMAHVSK